MGAAAPAKSILLKAGRILDVHSGKYIANADVTELERVQFVMKGGEVMKNILQKK